jgi:hypothetical protein
LDDENEEQVKNTQISTNNKPNETGSRKAPVVIDADNEASSIQPAPSIPGPTPSTTNYSSVDNEIWYV